LFDGDRWFQDQLVVDLLLLSYPGHVDPDREFSTRSVKPGKSKIKTSRDRFIRPVAIVQSCGPGVHSFCDTILASTSPTTSLHKFCRIIEITVFHAGADVPDVPMFPWPGSVQIAITRYPEDLFTRMASQLSEDAKTSVIIRRHAKRGPG